MQKETPINQVEINNEHNEKARATARATALKLISNFLTNPPRDAATALHKINEACNYIHRNNQYDDKKFSKSYTHFIEEKITLTFKDLTDNTIVESLLTDIFTPIQEQERVKLQDQSNIQKQQMNFNDPSSINAFVKFVSENKLNEEKKSSNVPYKNLKSFIKKTCAQWEADLDRNHLSKAYLALKFIEKNLPDLKNAGLITQSASIEPLRTKFNNAVNNISIDNIYTGHSAFWHVYENSDQLIRINADSYVEFTTKLNSLYANFNEALNNKLITGDILEEVRKNANAQLEQAKLNLLNNTRFVCE